MKKDIEIPKVRNVYLVAVKEWDKDFSEQQWNIYFVNDRKDRVSTILIVSRGRSEAKKTSTLRHNIGDLDPKSAAKVEFITSEVLGFTNEYLVTFFVDNTLFEKKFVFKPHSITEEKATELPVMEKEGILAD